MSGGTIHLGSREIGDRWPCFIIAEAGSNHNGSLEQAKQLIDVATWAGADAVKFQVFRASRLYPRNAGQSDYLKLRQPIYDIIEAMEMPYEWLPELAGRCRERGIIFLASVFDEESADRLDRYVPAFKIASYEMTHQPLIDHIARKGKPLIISTGAADFGEVSRMVEQTRRAGASQLALLQCTASYPAPVEALNIRAIATLKQTFGVPTGLSDHSRDALVGPIAAVAMGANLLEKHFTFSHHLPGPDHRFAVEPGELKLLVERVRQVEVALGSGEKSRHPVEAELHDFCRRYVFATQLIRKGAPFTADNVAILRKGKQPTGLSPGRWAALLDRRAARDLAPDEPVREQDVVWDV